MSSIDQQFIEYIVKSLVGNPDAVKIDRRIDEKGVLLELTVDPEDLGRVIGKRGATAQSLRTLLRALGTKNEARYNLKIVDNGEPQHSNGTAAPVSDSTDDDSAAVDDTVDAQEAPADSQESAEPEVAAPARDELSDLDDEDATPKTPTSDKLSKTRKELEDLDDLDI